MKWKRFLAMAGVVLILSMYLIAIISAFSHNPEAKKLADGRYIFLCRRPRLSLCRSACCPGDQT